MNRQLATAQTKAFCFFFSKKKALLAYLPTFTLRFANKAVPPY